ncbi:MAG: hypothetical protein IKL55_00150 [Clostridia bacterium]|nr:hypothetical protein [Clostridia bacterium]
MSNFFIYSNSLYIVKKYGNMLFNNFPTLHFLGIASTKKELEDALVSKKVDLIILSYEHYQNASISQLINSVNDKIIIYNNNENFLKSSTHTLYLSSNTNIENTQKKLKIFTQKLDEELIRKKVKKLLSKLNFDFKLIGTKYLLEAIVYSYLTRELYLFENLEKQIYPYVSKKYNVNPYNVKWAIIRSINNMKLKATEYELQYFSLESSEKITSKFIISEIVNRL